VRDQIHSRDVARLFLEFQAHPRMGEVYNLGGGRANSVSIRETIHLLADMGYQLRYEYRDTNRIGDHICYISDLTKIKSHFPNWTQEYDVPAIVSEIVERCVRIRVVAAARRFDCDHP
jgi:CDP-paratose 2-epimerase